MNKNERKKNLCRIKILYKLIFLKLLSYYMFYCIHYYMSKNSPIYMLEPGPVLLNFSGETGTPHTVHHISRFPNLIHRLFMAVNLYFGAMVAQW